MLSLSEILVNFVNIIHDGKCDATDDISRALCEMIEQSKRNKIIPSDNLISFTVEEQSIKRSIKDVELDLSKAIADYTRIHGAVAYVLDELTCNILEHSMSKNGSIYTKFDNKSNEICIILTDYGKTIFGSYATGRYAKKVTDDMEALKYASQGYSTKNLPDAENRGYGISTSNKMVTKGLNGEFAIVSGRSALYNDKLLELPEGVCWDGTMVMMKFSVNVPNGFAIYKYLS